MNDFWPEMKFIGLKYISAIRPLISLVIHLNGPIAIESTSKLPFMAMKYVKCNLLRSELIKLMLDAPTRTRLKKVTNIVI